MSWLSDRTIDHLREVTERPDLSQTKYRGLEKVATGGMGTVYRARDTQLGRDVAIKVLDVPDNDGKLAARMLQEARVIAALEHPSIVPIHDVGTLPDGRIFYAMKFVRGRQLDVEVRRASSLPNLLRTYQKIGEAAAFAHAHNVVHRDLKPENVMVCDFGEVLVMDWGLAKVLGDNDGNPEASSQTGRKKATTSKPPPARTVLLSESSQHLTGHGTIMGTPAYMSPEQQSGEIDLIDQRTDVYALGAILDFILTSLYPGDHLENKSTLAWLRKWRRKPPKQLAAITKKAMARQRVDRYPSAMDLIKDIEHFLHGGPVSAYRENLLELVWRLAKQYRFLIILIFVYILAKLVTLFLGQL